MLVPIPPADADDQRRLAAQFDAGERPGLPVLGALVFTEHVERARGVKQQRHRMVGYFDALYFLVIGQDDVAVAERLSARHPQDVLHSGRHRSDPLQVLRRGEHFRRNHADEGVGIGDFGLDARRVGGDHTHFRRHRLELRDLSRARIVKDDLPGLPGKQTDGKQQRNKQAWHRVHSTAACKGKLPEGPGFGAARRARSPARTVRPRTGLPHSTHLVNSSKACAGRVRSAERAAPTCNAAGIVS